MRLPLRDCLAGIEPYGAPQLAVAHPLNVNENPYPPSAGMVADITQAVQAAAAGLNRYPDRDFLALRAALAGYLAKESGVQVPAENVWAANGSNEVMPQILQAFGGEGRAVLTSTPSYSMYPEYARDTGTRFLDVPRNADFTLDLEAIARTVAAEHPAVIVLASPNNPTGTALGIEDVRRLADLTAQAGPDGAACVLVIDEAYGEFRRPGTPSALELLADYEHLAVSRTMSKAFGMAGLRLGYLAASRAIIDALMVVRLPYHLSALTQAAALAAVGHADEQLAQIGELRDRRDDLVVYLRSAGFDVVDSDANFVLFGRFADRHAVFEGMKDRGVLIREVGPAGYLRVSVGSAEDDRAFRLALQEVCS